jgi:hypothetical protein
MRAFWIEESEKGVLLASGLGADAERRQPQRAELKARQSEACRRWWVGKLTLGGGARRRLRAGQRRRSKTRLARLVSSRGDVGTAIPRIAVRL